MRIKPDALTELVGARILNDQQVQFVTIGDLEVYQAAWGLRIPAFQRPQVWSAQMQQAYARNVLCGVPSAMFMLWRIQYPDSRRMFIVDGQNRLYALGFNLTRSDKQQAGCRAYLDVSDGTWHEEPGPNRKTMYELATQHHDNGPYKAQMEAAMRRLHEYRLPVQYFGVGGLDVDRQTMEQIFVGLTTPGIPLSQEDARQLVEGALRLAL